MTHTTTTRTNLRSAFTLALIGAVAIFSASCGGGGGGSEGAGRGLVLLSFSEAGVDNVVLNKRLEFRFSEAVDASTINNASVQLREGNAFGLSVFGDYRIQGSTVIFEPQLASLCDQSDSGFKPDTQYRVQLMGFPEEFAVRNGSGQSLDSTRTYEFHTRTDSDPDKYADQIPGVGPSVVSTSPANGDQAVIVAGGNRIEIVLSENVNPCTVDATTVLVDIYEQGDPAVLAPAPNLKNSGFSSDGTNNGSTDDQLPGDFTTWGAVGTDNFGGTPRRLLCDIQLVQDFNGTKIIATPVFGLANGAAKFPENVMIVVQMTFAIQDFGNLPMSPTIFSFTTENLATSNSEYLIANEGETNYIGSKTTAAVHPDPRSPNRVQAFMLFAGDGDNGSDQLKPSLPKGVAGCTLPFQPNNGSTDDFAPGADVTLDTGATRNLCPNDTDGSTAVIWEFATMRITNGVTVRITGVNPAIILVQGDIIIEAGGRLLVRGDGANGTPKGNGAGGTSYTTAAQADGGVGVAGGGNGGSCPQPKQNHRYGDDGWAGLGSADYDWTMTNGSSGEDGIGAGRAGQPAGAVTSSPWDGSSAGGGGAGHATAGEDGSKVSGNTWPLKLSPRGQGGATYERSGNSGDKLQLPEAGSGGGPAGFINGRTFTTSTSYVASGGAGGAGGGFLDLTSSGDIQILGMLDAAGGRGGNGSTWQTYYASGGGGGGSGGGLRLLTPNAIEFSATTVVSAAGGAAGTGAVPGGTNTSKRNNGGAGGNGRLVFETSDSLIKNLAAANVTPVDGAPGFYRGVFDAARFQGGGLSPSALTTLIPIGNHQGFNPTFVEPVAGDFVVGVPVAGSPGIGKTAILVEVSGVQMNADGTPDFGSQTDFYSVGHFTDNGVEASPDWNFGHPNIADVPFPSDNAGAGFVGFAALNAAAAGNGYELLQVRFSFYLPLTVGPFDPGSLLDDWTIRFTHEN